MDISDFKVGARYTVATKAFECPDGSGIIPGKEMLITILPPQEFGEATAYDGYESTLATQMEVDSRKTLLRVKRDSGRVHLLDPHSIDSASIVH